MLSFRQLAPEEEEAGYAVLVDSVAWQLSKSIRLWEKPLPRDVYALRHAGRQNFGLFDDQRLVAVVSLTHRVPDLWREHVATLDAPWLTTLAVARDAHGRSLGDHVVEHACAHLAARSEPVVYLDCALGFLETWYTKHDFHPIARGSFCGAPGAFAVPAVLMARDLAVSNFPAKNTP